MDNFPKINSYEIQLSTLTDYDKNQSGLSYIINKEEFIAIHNNINNYLEFVYSETQLIEEMAYNNKNSGFLLLCRFIFPDFSRQNE